MSDKANADDKKKIQHSIARLLGMREHSYVELVKKLLQKEFDPELVSTVLAEYVDKGLQSDARYAEVFTRSAYEKGKGPSLIEQSLKQHNIDDSLITACLKNEVFDWYESAAKARAKRFGEALPTDWDEQQKQKRFLQYRGFYQDHINESFRP